MNAVHVGITGAHSTGKTTIARRSEMELRAVGLRVVRISGFARQAASLGFPKMHDHTIESAEWIMAMQTSTALEESLSSDVVIHDRTAWDTAAYLLAKDSSRTDRRSMAVVQLAALHARRYQVLVATECSKPVVTEKSDSRYQDESFRERVGAELISLLELHSISYFRAGESDHAKAVGIILDRVLASVQESQDADD